MLIVSMIILLIINSEGSEIGSERSGYVN